MATSESIDSATRPSPSAWAKAFLHPGKIGTVAASDESPAMIETTHEAHLAGQWRIAFDRAWATDALGDLLLLAEDAPAPTLSREARRLVARRLLAHHQLILAREQLSALTDGQPTARLEQDLLDDLARGPQQECEHEREGTDKHEGKSTRENNRDGKSDRQGNGEGDDRCTTGASTAARVWLFSGHMIDAPNRTTPRFPASKEGIAAGAIAAALDELGAQAGELALCGGACGGDILFAEACLARGLRLHLYLPFDTTAFLEASVAFAGPQWVARFRALASDPRTTVRIMPRVLGSTPPEANAYERNNRWQLCNALVTGPVHLLALWNRQGGDGPGGTAHMVERVRSLQGQATILDTTRLWSPPPREG